MPFFSHYFFQQFSMFSRYKVAAGPFPNYGVNKGHLFKRLSSLCSRASRELDGHQGDPAGGHGVPAEVPGGHHGGAAQRGGAFCGRRQENSGHGKEETASPVCHHTPPSCYSPVGTASAWLPTVSPLVSGASSHSEDAISLDTVAEYSARPALSSSRSLIVIGLGSTALDNEVSGSRTVRREGGSGGCDQV